MDELHPMTAKVRAQAVYHQLGSGVHPSLLQVVQLRGLFSEEENGPYSLRRLRRSHVVSTGCIFRYTLLLGSFGLGILGMLVV